MSAGHTQQPAEPPGRPPCGQGLGQRRQQLPAGRGAAPARQHRGSHRCGALAAPTERGSRVPESPWATHGPLTCATARSPRARASGEAAEPRRCPAAILLRRGSAGPPLRLLGPPLLCERRGVRGASGPRRAGRCAGARPPAAGRRAARREPPTTGRPRGLCGARTERAGLDTGGDGAPGPRAAMGGLRTGLSGEDGAHGQRQEVQAAMGNTERVG